MSPANKKTAATIALLAMAMPFGLACAATGGGNKPAAPSSDTETRAEPRTAAEPAKAPAAQAAISYKLVIDGIT